MTDRRPGHVGLVLVAATMVPWAGVGAWEAPTAQELGLPAAAVDSGLDTCLKVRSEMVHVCRLSADYLDGQDSTEFLGRFEKAADSEFLDGRDSGDFAPAGHDHDSRYYPLGAKVSDTDRLDGLDSDDFAPAGHRHPSSVFIATVPNQTTTAVCDGDQHPFPNLSIAIDLAGPAMLDVTSGVNAVIDGQTQTSISIDGQGAGGHSTDVFTLNGRVTFNAAWATEAGPGSHTIELVYRCLATALFDNSGRLIVRVSSS